MSDTGNIASIWRFPIKSFQGEAVPAAQLAQTGIHGDRPLALRDCASGKILSGKHAKLGEAILQFSARYRGEPEPGKPLPSIVADIGGQQVSSDDPEHFGRVCSEVLGIDVELVAAGSEPVIFDIYYPEMAELPLSDMTIEFPLGLAEQGSFVDLEPLHLLTTASLAELQRLAPDSRMASGRFRPSLLIDNGADGGFIENDWAGRTARLGGATLEFGEACPRCIMTTRPQGDLPRDPKVLKALAQQNMLEVLGMQMPCLGVYARVTEPGEVRVGDTLTFL